jgi:enterochelin esterase-like enzyme
MGNLVVTTPGFLAVLTALAALGLVFAFRRWARRRLVSASVLTLATVVFALLSVADFVNAHYEYAPQARDVADLAFPGVAYRSLSNADLTRGMSHPHGGVVRIALPDGGDGFGRSHELVYLPQAYFTSTAPLPVVYLLHGSPGSAEDWFRAAHAASVGARLNRLGEPTILVAPEMSRHWTGDTECVDGARLHAESHLLDVVIPATERDLRVRTDRAGRSIAGNSAGGFCALNVGLRHRDEFATIVDLSGFTRPTYTGGLAKLFGGPSADLDERIRANSPDAYAPTLPPGPAVQIWFDAGRSDQGSERQEAALAQHIGGRTDLTVKLVTRPGGHTYGVWRPALRDALVWAEARPD